MTPAPGAARSPLAELRAFARAALVAPVPRDHSESDAAFRRRRIVAALTLICGMATLAASLRVPPGDDRFYAHTFALAVIWIVGALASGPLHLGHAWTRRGEPTGRAIVQSLSLAGLLIALFLAGALVVAQLPVLRGPVDDLLDHARFGSLPLVAALTAANGVGEEMYFRGALYAAIGRRGAVAASTLIYTLTTIVTGIPLLVLAAALLGTVTALQRRVTGGLLGPIIVHVTWSAAMLFALPVLLDQLGPR